MMAEAVSCKTHLKFFLLQTSAKLMLLQLESGSYPCYSSLFQEIPNSAGWQQTFAVCLCRAHTSHCWKNDKK